MLQQGVIPIADYRRYVRAPMPRPQDVHLSGVMGQAPYFGEYVKQQLIDQARREARLRRRLPRVHDDRPPVAEARARRDRQVAAEPRRAAGRARRDQPEHGRGARDVRRPQLPPEPVQPCGAGRAPAGLVVQAVRARDRAQAGHLAALDVRVEAGVDLPRQQVLVRPQLRGRVPRPDRPRQGDLRLGQLGVRAADEGRWAVERRADGEAARDPEPAPELLRDRARRAGGEPARDGARVRHVRERRLQRQRQGVREPAARDHDDQGRERQRRLRQHARAQAR